MHGREIKDGWTNASLTSHLEGTMEPLSWCRERLERHRWRQSQIEQTIKDFRETADGGEFATRKLAELQFQLSESNADVADALDRLHHFAAESAVLSHGRLLIRQRRLGSGAPSLRRAHGDRRGLQATCEF